MKKFPYSRLIDDCDGRGVLMKVLIAMVKKWFDFSLLGLIGRMEVDRTLAFVAVARSCEGYWDALDSND